MERNGSESVSKEGEVVVEGGSGAGVEGFGCQLFTAVIGEVGSRPPEVTGVTDVHVIEG